ncbi:MAG TPA: hypothetical protein VHL80_15605 [Polyangia bacterium]|nr:hypothetical protein [Polyangia bacterium]
MRAHITFVRLATLTLAAALSAGLVGGCGGKGTEGTCGTYPACGGTPNGDWSLMTGCSNLVVTPYQQPSLPQQLAQPQTPTVAPPQVMPTTSGDWCSQLVYEPSTNPMMPVRSVVLWHGPPTVHSGYVHMNDDHTFAASITFITLEHTYFPSACITRYESNPSMPLTCEKLGIDLASYEQTQPGFMFDQPMSCTGDINVGCDCSYHYQVQSGAMGTWGVDPANAGLIVFSSSVTTEPQSASFCQNASTLQLSGDNGTDLFGAQGLRSAQFARM